MNKISQPWFKNVSISIATMLALVILLIIFQHIELISFVENGRQTLWGIVLFLFLWPLLMAFVIVTFEQMAGMGIFLIALLLGVGLFLNIIYMMGIGSLIHFFLPKNPYKS